MAKPTVVEELLAEQATTACRYCGKPGTVEEAIATLEAVAASIADERVAKEEFTQAIVKRLRAAS